MKPEIQKRICEFIEEMRNLGGIIAVLNKDPNNNSCDTIQDFRLGQTGLVDMCMGIIHRELREGRFKIPEISTYAIAQREVKKKKKKG